MTFNNTTFGQFHDLLNLTAADAFKREYLLTIDANRPVDDVINELSGANKDGSRLLLSQLLLCAQTSQYASQATLQHYIGRITTALTPPATPSLQPDTTALFFSLPKEIISTILEYLSNKDREALLSSCRYLNGDIRKFVLIQPYYQAMCSRYIRCHISGNDSTFACIRTPQAWERLNQQIAEQGRNITFLDLSYCLAVSDSTLAAIVQLFPNLKHLELKWCNQLTDQGLQALQYLTQLQYLDLYGCDQLTDQGIQVLQRLTQLRYLYLSWCNQLTDQGIQVLQHLIQLQHLNLNGCNQLTDQGIQVLQHLTHLQYLNRNDCNRLTNRGLHMLQNNLPQLKISPALAWQ